MRDGEPYSNYAFPEADRRAVVQGGGLHGPTYEIYAVMPRFHIVRVDGDHVLSGNWPTVDGARAAIQRLVEN